MVMAEVERAKSYNKFIFLYRSEDIKPSDQLELFISSNHWMDAFLFTFDENLRTLRESCNELLGNKNHQSFVAPQTVAIQPGRFLFGALPNDTHAKQWETPCHSVALSKPVAIGKYPVTFDEFDQYCIHEKLPLVDDEGWGRGKRPVVNVTWYQAVQYCRWLSNMTGRIYRLPTEIEWEYACGSTVWPSSEDTASHQLAHYKLGEFRQLGLFGIGALVKKKVSPLIGTAPVGLYPANENGLHDMHGNVWEWVLNDWTSRHTGDFDIDPGLSNLADETASIHDKVLKGGAWCTQHATLRTSSRTGANPDEFSNSWGFRVASFVD
jgi:formylglycine-generating enzyme required for sulfatase activity